MDISNTRASELLKNAIFKQESGNIHEAISLLKSAISIDDKLHSAHLRLGYLLHKTGFYDGAIPHLKTCAKITKNADAFYLLGHCYYLKHQHTAAQKAYGKALKINKNLHDAKAGIGTILFDTGHLTQAQTLIFPYIKNRQYNTNIASLYSRICIKNNNCDELLNYLNDWLKFIAPTSQESTASQINFLIGDIYDSQQQYNKALKSYVLANSTITSTYNPFEHEIAISEIIKIYSPALFMGRVTSSNRTQTPIFIVGMPRSGTSLIEQIISSHSQVFGAGELPFISDLKTEISAENNKAFPECVTTLNAETLREKAEKYIVEVSNLSNNALHVIDKMPHNFLYLGLIYQIFPNCKIIHCKRNPIDTCLSIFSKPFNVTHSYSSDFDDLAHHYLHYQRIMKHWKQVLPNSIYEINYEKIISNSNEEVKKLIQFCGLDWEEDCLNFHQTKRKVITASKDQVNKPLYTSSIERWKKYFPDVEPLVASLNKYNIDIG